MLDNNGRGYAEDLPNLLEKHGLMPEIVLVDRSEPKAQRCDSTMAKVFERSPCREELRRQDLLAQLDSCAPASVVAICYMSVSLRYMPPVRGAPKGLEQWMGDASRSKPPACITNWLYENILVSERTADGINFVRTIPTGNSRTD